MKKYVAESIQELFEAKAAKAADAQNKIEKGKTTKITQTSGEKAKQSIAALKKQLEDAKKGKSFKTTLEKNAKIKELTDKIKAWESKLK